MNVVPLELATEINNAVGCFFKGFYSFLLMKVKLEMNLNMAKKNMNKEKSPCTTRGVKYCRTFLML